MQKRDQVDDDERRRLRSVVSRTAHSACSCRGYRAPRTLIEYVSLTRGCGAVSGVRGCHCVSKLSRSSQRDSMRINVTDSRSAPAFATLLAFAFFDNCRRGEERSLVSNRFKFDRGKRSWWMVDGSLLYFVLCYSTP